MRPTGGTGTSFGTMSQTMQRGPVTGTAVKKTTSRRPFLLDLYGTAVGKKYVMAITGILLIGFVVAHMIGNLKVYLGAVEHEGSEAYDLDIYAEYLRELLAPIAPHGYVLWGMRIGLIVADVAPSEMRIVLRDKSNEGS